MARYETLAPLMSCGTVSITTAVTQTTSLAAALSLWGLSLAEGKEREREKERMMFGEQTSLEPE